MYKVTKYPHGTFSWADCNTSDWLAGKQFYTELMGWETEDLPLYGDVVYTRFQKDGENIAALLPLASDYDANKMSSHWKCFITVDNVDALAPQVEVLGGKILQEPFDALEDGRMMTIQEPTGAVVSLWQAKNMIGAGLVNTVGAMLWNEILTPDPQTTMDFFHKLLGWDYQQDGERDYYMILNQERMNGGIFKITEEMGNVPSSCMVYFNVADLESSLEKLSARGGKVHMKGQAGEVGAFAVVSDPQGASFYLMQSNIIDTWEEK